VCLLTRRSWIDVRGAGAGYVAGWVTFIAYYVLQPAQWALFRDHASVNLELTLTTAAPGISRFLRSDAEINGDPPRAEDGGIISR